MSKFKENMYKPNHVFFAFEEKQPLLIFFSADNLFSSSKILFDYNVINHVMSTENNFCFLFTICLVLLMNFKILGIPIACEVSI